MLGKSAELSFQCSPGRQKHINIVFVFLPYLHPHAASRVRNILLSFVDGWPKEYLISRPYSTRCLEPFLYLRLCKHSHGSWQSCVNCFAHVELRKVILNTTALICWHYTVFRKKTPTDSFFHISIHHSWRYERKCEWVFFFWTQCIWISLHLSPPHLSWQ